MNRHYCLLFVSGYARLASLSDRTGTPPRWSLPPGMNPRALSSTFKLQWLNRCPPLILSCRDNIPLSVNEYSENSKRTKFEYFPKKSLKLIE